MTKPKSVSIILDKDKLTRYLRKHWGQTPREAAELFERIQAGAIEAGFISPDGGPKVSPYLRKVLIDHYRRIDAEEGKDE